MPETPQKKSLHSPFPDIFSFRGWDFILLERYKPLFRKPDKTCHLCGLGPCRPLTNLSLAEAKGLPLASHSFVDLNNCLCDPSEAEKQTRFYSLLNSIFVIQNLFMCLAIPMKIVERSGDSGVVEIRGVRRSVTLSLVDAVIGDYVLVHAGVAIGKVDEKEAEETTALLQELMKEDYPEE